MVKTGISTASLFGRFDTENAIKFLSDNNVSFAEVFLESFCEYNREFGKLIAKNKGKTRVHSVHTLTTQFEPTLYSANIKARDDSFILLENAMQAAEEIGANYYTFHGGARFKRTPYNIDFDKCGKTTQEIIDVCKKHGVTLAYENVHWGYYNYIGFFSELKKRVNGLKGTFDIKQARQSGYDYKDYIKEMGEDIVTVHLSDTDENGKLCLPGKGITDFNDLFLRLRDYGFNGAILLEVYKENFNEYSELFESLNFINNLAEKIFVG